MSESFSSGFAACAQRLFAVVALLSAERFVEPDNPFLAIDAIGDRPSQTEDDQGNGEPRPKHPHLLSLSS